MRCLNCGKELEGKRAKNCSDACRKAYSRRKKNLDHAIESVNKGLAVILLCTKDDEEDVREKALKYLGEFVKAFNDV